ncbi:hypothetical protein F5880DRAFT_70730 [Lentinula raphanica]|nr:hypothetical protein F5880DRAFT_70730 [Lentinula raphanica]
MILLSPSSSRLLTGLLFLSTLFGVTAAPVNAHRQETKSYGVGVISTVKNLWTKATGRTKATGKSTLLNLGPSTQDFRTHCCEGGAKKDMTVVLYAISNRQEIRYYDLPPTLGEQWVLFVDDIRLELGGGQGGGEENTVDQLVPNRSQGVSPALRFGYPSGGLVLATMPATFPDIKSKRRFAWQLVRCQGDTWLDKLNAMMTGPVQNLYGSVPTKWIEKRDFMREVIEYGEGHWCHLPVDDPENTHGLRGEDIHRCKTRDDCPVCSLHDESGVVSFDCVNQQEVQKEGKPEPQWRYYREKTKEWYCYDHAPREEEFRWHRVMENGIEVDTDDLTSTMSSSTEDSAF